jgi:hypothetical protein
VEIWRKNKVEVEQMIKKLQDENEELKGRKT